MPSPDRYQQRRDAGLCTSCGSDEALDDPRTGKKRAKCERCAKRHAGILVGHRSERRQDGRCERCNDNPAEPDRNHCASCLKAERDRSAASYVPTTAEREDRTPTPIAAPKRVRKARATATPRKADLKPPTTRKAQAATAASSSTKRTTSAKAKAPAKKAATAASSSTKRTTPAKGKAPAKKAAPPRKRTAAPKPATKTRTRKAGSSKTKPRRPATTRTASRTAKKPSAKQTKRKASAKKRAA